MKKPHVPSHKILKLYDKFKKQHQSIMLELLSEAYKEGYDDCVEKENLCRTKFY